MEYQWNGISIFNPRSKQQQQQQILHFLQKERDLELAARIGQSLLKKNKALSERNDLLEEQVEHIREEVRGPECVFREGFSVD